MIRSISKRTARKLPQGQCRSSTMASALSSRSKVRLNIDPDQMKARASGQGRHRCVELDRLCISGCGADRAWLCDCRPAAQSEAESRISGLQLSRRRSDPDRERQARGQRGGQHGDVHRQRERHQGPTLLKAGRMIGLLCQGRRLGGDRFLEHRAAGGRRQGLRQVGQPGRHRRQRRLRHEDRGSGAVRQGGRADAKAPMCWSAASSPCR